MRGITAARRVRRSLLARAGAAVAAAAGLALAGATAALAAGATLAPAAGATVAPAILQALDCHSVSQCVAVGVNTPVKPSQLAWDNWNGTSWTRSYPVVASDGNYPILKSVSCSSATACLAVGNNADGVFTERLTGQGFVPDTSPFTGGTPRYVLQVRCLSATRCVALASAWPNSQSWRSEAEFWNGSSWRTVLTS